MVEPAQLRALPRKHGRDLVVLARTTAVRERERKRRAVRARDLVEEPDAMECCELRHLREDGRPLALSTRLQSAERVAAVVSVTTRI